MGGRTIKSSIAIDNGRAAEFIKHKDYPNKSTCYECGEEGHLSYKCTKNTLGERQPPPKKVKVKNKNKGDTDAKTSYYDSDSNDGLREAKKDIAADLNADSSDEISEPDESLSSVIREEVST